MLQPRSGVFVITCTLSNGSHTSNETLLVSPILMSDLSGSPTKE